MPAGMTDATNGHRPSERAVRIAAAGDIHCHEGNREETAAAFATLEDRADLVLLAGDLSTHGETEQADVLADAVRDVDLPIFAVLGNHDWHVDRPKEFVAVLEDAGITVLERAWATPCVNGVEIGIVGAKGFVGGFPGSHLPDFGEPLMRECYAETGRDVDAIDARPARRRALRGARRAAALRADRADAAGRAARRSGRCSAPTVSRRRSPRTSPTSSSTATRTRGASRARSATCRSTTCRCP